MEDLLETFGKDTAKIIFIVLIASIVLFFARLIGNILNKEFSDHQIGFAFQTLLVLVGLGIIIFGDLWLGSGFVLVGLYNHILLHRNIKKRSKGEQKKSDN